MNKLHSSIKDKVVVISSRTFLSVTHRVLFSLSQSEFEEASKVYPNLLMNGDDRYYTQYSATSGINLGYDMYFDNETILNRFERLF